ncbi:TrkA-N domain protein [Halorhabdus utahensis DSM 12940]|uniref:TrkA-N domain protein n=1 Tax=Halorhabdus utahensis (strain DSM 12940 / JCM 11049 / AX-2) TaxID=519442 RepID=C7NN91_HALUD|nr:NAD-binding protein [Halorhabdus utahensis]ACV11491.1 TrkA-N domain protein [Halorhabdus utahensis DSM 12940]
MSERNLDDRLSPKHDHVIVCEYRRDSAVFLDELDEFGIEYVLLSADRDAATALSDDGYAAIHDSPQDAAALERAGIDEARAVITDAGDATVNTILTVRSVDPDVEIIALTDDSDMREILLETGADSVLSPHGVLGHRLAEKAVSAFSAELSDTIDVGTDLEVTEVPIPHGSQLIGTRIRDSEIRERTGATAVGAWIDGELQLPLDPDATIQPNTVLIVTGSHDCLTVFGDVVRSAHAFDRHERIVVEDDAGHTTTLDPDRSLTGEERITVVGSDESIQQFLRRYDASPTDIEG